MKRIAAIAAAIAATLAGTLHAKSPEDIYKEFSGAMAIVEFKLDTATGIRNAAGFAFCIHSDQQGRAVFLTTAFGLRTRLTEISGLRIRPSGMDTKSVAGEVMGVDPPTGMGFVRTVAAANWPKVVFVGRQSGVKIGQQIVSIGLQNSDQGYEPYMGVAYVSGRVRTPETMYRVTGGRLTASCSPVFNLDGKAVGLVGRQVPAPFQMVTSQGRTQIGLSNLDENNYFLPIDEFAATIANMPSPTSPRRLVWTGAVAYHPVTDDDAKTYGINVPAVMVGKVIKGTPAEKAGLKERDLIIALGGLQLEKFPRPGLVVARFVKQLQKASVAGTKQVALTVRRGSKQLSLTVGLVPIPKQGFEAPQYVSRELGMAIREKVPADSYADSSPTANVKGLIVLSAPKKGPAGTGGVRRGDLLIGVNGKPVTTVAQIQAVLGKALKDSPGKAVALLVQRGNKTYPISVLLSDQ